MKWRVNLNSKLWDQSKYTQLWNEKSKERRLAQSKGGCRMVLCPTQGDEVSFVYKGKIVMKGYVESDEFEHGTAHQNHSCNLQTIRPHSVPEYFVWIRITEINLSIDVPHRGQRTWIKM